MKCHFISLSILSIYLFASIIKKSEYITEENYERMGFELLQPYSWLEEIRFFIRSTKKKYTIVLSQYTYRYNTTHMYTKLSIEFKNDTHIKDLGYPTDNNNQYIYR